MIRILAVTGLFLLFLTPGDAAESTSARFGFSGPEIFPIDAGIGQLKSADMNGDGLEDLVVVNNARSRIQILINQTGKTNLPAADKRSTRRDLNELPPDARFRIESIASEKRISSLVVADLNNDGRPDIAYYGEPKELIVQYNEGTNGWSALKRFPIEDGALEPYALASGDLNGDKLQDLVLLSENTIYYLAQRPDHTLAEPEKISYSGTIKAVQILDIQGDGRDDLLLSNWDSANPFRFRLQNSQGQLGPEVYFALPPIRSYWADDLDGDHKTEIITIARNSGRAEISNFAQKPAEPLLGSWLQGQFEIMPLTKTTKSRRGTVWADVNSDGLPDLLIAEPDSGQLALYLQRKDGRLDAPKFFPTFTGVTEIVAADWNTNGRPDLLLLSSDERQIGITQLDDKGRIGFPKILPFEGRPLSIAYGDLKLEGEPAFGVILDLDGKRELQLRSRSGKVRRQKLAEAFKGDPGSMIVHDVNQDGLPDLVVMVPYDKIKILLQVSGKDFEEIDITPPGGGTEQPWAATADVDGDGKPELLLPQKNFLRAVVLQAETRAGQTNRSWSLNVKEQINGAGSNSRIIGAAALPRTDSKAVSLFLFDAERRALTLCDRDKSGVWQVVRNIPLPFTEFLSAQAVHLGSGNAQSISLLGLNAVGLFGLQGEVWQFAELDGYETPIKDGNLHDVISGDLNQDGRKDLVFLESSKGYVDLVTFEKPHQLVPANRWPVFEERTFRNRRSDAGEPREALIVDVTGDKKNDLVVVVHDRILLYPQE
ncbi:MAG: repeat protein [Verrucomicrobiales bacterium]|nr:repeat protein [Verrucomicrobiales bacterium]